MQCLKIVQILRQQPVGEKIAVQGWVKTVRHSKSVSFIAINDGSCLTNLQVLAGLDLGQDENELKELATGCSLRVTGTLAASPAQGQAVELQTETLEILGLAPNYPLQKKRHTFEYLREIAHLRPRTNSIGAVARVRSALAFAVHNFFKERGFFYIHTPIISTGDCEGAGETFTVTALDLERLAKAGSSSTPLWADDFFGCHANLTVSGQLEAEAYAMALGNVYTFGPTFRAENSNTSRHLSEFWMIEPEMAFCTLPEDIDMAEQFIKYLIKTLLRDCLEDLELFASFIDKELFQRLRNVSEKTFIRLTYTEAITELQNSKKSFKFPVTWGMDLQSEHERYLSEEIFAQPVVLTDYPKTIKPFYMRVNDDQKTVAAMDVLCPGIGEIIGGSQREERLENLLARMQELRMATGEYEWYLDLRRYGTAPHAGFGLGFERLVQFVTGMKNIRDVIPFPRTPGSALF
jgi:asparaginyl-tRNA synthetase